MTFEEALAAPGKKVQIPATEVEDGKRALLLYRVDDHGAKLLAQTSLSEPDLLAMGADLKARGVALAETDFVSEMVWARTEDGIVVYDARRKLFEAAGERATNLAGDVIARGDLSRVVTYADGYAERGIKGVLRSGEEIKLVIEFSLAAEEDYTYSRNQLLNETEWCGRIAIAIAKWAGAEYENRI